jgi:hypothetical protein
MTYFHLPDKSMRYASERSCDNGGISWFLFLDHGYEVKQYDLNRVAFFLLDGGTKDKI